MQPYLLATAGSLKGKSISLSEPRIFIGRGPMNYVCIDSHCASRRHCLIEQVESGLRITDLGSRNGTFVNEVPVTQRLILHGDIIRIGDTSFLAMLDEPELLPARPEVEFSYEEPPAATTIELNIQGELCQRTLEDAARQEPPERGERDLGVLLRVGRILASARDLRELQRALLEAIFMVIPAQRGALMLTSGGGQEFTFLHASPGATEPTAAFEINRAVIDRVLQKGVALLSNGMSAGETSPGSDRFLAPGVRSVLAAPLAVTEREVGVVYLDSCDPDLQFKQWHLELLTAIGAIAAPALHNARRLEEIEECQRRLLSDIRVSSRIVGESPTMQTILDFIAKVAPSDSTVLITGESGTGKQLVARAVHANSPRTGRPYVEINCATLSETLLESELFGHERGAFTSAIAQKKGTLEMCDGGTVVLDELGELAPGLQSKLLRVLQEREFSRVGGTRPIRVDIRVIATTNRDMEEAVRAGSIREDLYYRLNVVSVEVPPLRERREDVALLARYFVHIYRKRSGRDVQGISDEAMRLLMDYDWPGNVRELENAIERAIVLGSDTLILPEDLPEAVLESRRTPCEGISKYHQTLLDTKRRLILQAYKQTNGRHTETARLLGIHPNHLHRVIRNMNLKASLRKRA